MTEKTDEYGLVTVLQGQIEAPDGPFARQRAAIRKAYQPVVAEAERWKIANASSYETAIQLGRMLQALSGNITEFYRPVKQVFDAAKKIVLDMEKVDAGAVSTAKAELSKKVLAYEKAQERVRLEAERIAREALRKAEEERRLSEAIELEQAGYKEDAVRLLDAEELGAPVILQAVIPPKISGSVRRSKWRATVNNSLLLVKGIAEGKVPILAIKIDQSWLDKQADQFQGGLNYPGVSTYEEEKHHFRS